MTKTNATPANAPKVHATMFDGLAFTSHRAGEWGYCDPSNAFDMFGPRYATREQLVADLARFGAEFTGQTPATSGAPQSQWIDMTADTARHMLRGDAKLVAHYDALASRAAALEELVNCCTVVAMRCVLDDDRYYHEADAKRFYAALEAAKVTL